MAGFNHAEIGRIAKFLTVGIFNTLIGLSAIYLLKYFAGWDDLRANLAGYAVGICNSYLLNSRWTFSVHVWRIAHFMKFLMVNGIAYLANLATVLTSIHIAQLDSYMAQAMGMPAFTVTCYILSRVFVFRECNSELRTTAASQP